MHLAIGSFKILDSALWAKLADLEKNGIVEDLRQTNLGRKAILTERDKGRIIALMDREPENNAAEIKSKLKLKCNTLPIRNFLKESGFKFLRIISVPRLTTDQKEERVVFARRHWYDDWSNTFFLDESKFHLGLRTSGE